MGKIATLFIFLVIGVYAHAALLERDLSTVGDRLLTYDESTGLEWLDLTPTIGIDYNDVEASNYITELGFRYASQSEIATLFVNAGASGTLYYDPSESVSIVVENFSAAVLLIELMGCTSHVLGVPCDGTEQNWQVGLFGDSAPTLENKNAVIVDYFGEGDYRNGRAAMWLDWGNNVSSFETRTDVASYLVREAVVPLPTAIWLFLSSLGALLGARRLI